MGRYLLLDRIGAGGMGRVYKAKHLMMGRTVALKILTTMHSKSGTRVARFRREMEIVGMLDHPNIVRAFDADQFGELLYIVMEYVPGKSLAEHLKQRGKLPLTEVLWYGAQAALGLDHAHKQGVLHRDVKPSNILLCESHKVKILDLGLGIFLERDASDEFKTEAGITVGTFDYLSPEQACMKKLDGRSDIYALGCTMYHLMSGRLPFEGDSSMERMAVRISGQTVPIETVMAGLPAPVGRVMEKMLARNPDDRFQTAGEVAQALSALVRPKAAATATPAPPSPPAAAPTPVPTPTPPVSAVAPTVVARAGQQPTSSRLDRLRSEFLKLRKMSPRVQAAIVAALVLVALGEVFLLWRGGGHTKDVSPAIPWAQELAPAAPVVNVKPTTAPSVAAKSSTKSDPATLGKDLAEKGQWKEAAAAYVKASEENPDNLSLIHRLSVSLLKAGDFEAYRQKCKDILEEVRGTDNPGAVDVIRASSLAPGILTDTDWALSLVQGTVDRDPKAAWRLYILGLTDYRANQFDQAVRHLEESINVDPMWAASFLNWPVLAMAHRRLGHAQEAQTWIQKARSWHGVPTPNAVQDGAAVAHAPVVGHR